MALIDITPTMTSNTTPSPYVVSGSSIHLTRNFYNVFTSDMTVSWHSGSGNQHWIQLDFGNSVEVDYFSMSGASSHAPKEFSLYGSNDGAIYEKIYSTTETNWLASIETRLFKLNTTYKYRYYKISTASNNGYVAGGNPHTIIFAIRFYKDDGIQPEPVSSSKASLNYCLPKNSTPNMEQRQNDPREGLLGFANDPDDRYGTLYMIDNKGQAIIPKAGTKYDLLWEGSVSADNTIINLSNKISDYKLLMIQCGTQETLVQSSFVVAKVNEYGMVRVTTDNGAYTNIAFTINTEQSIKITSVFSAYWIANLKKIYGIY